MASTSVALKDVNPVAAGTLQRVQAARFVENGAGTYNADFFIPAYAIIDDIQVMSEVLWTAATSAVLDVGDFLATDQWTISTAVDADGFWAAIDLKATDLLAGETLSFAASPAATPTVPAADTGAYLDGTVTHILRRMAVVDRFIRATIVSVGAGTAGRTVVCVTYSAPELIEITQ